MENHTNLTGVEKSSINMGKLTTKQKLFIDNYLTHFNATRAAIQAGYSEKTAAVVGHENLRKPNISAHIETCLEQSHMNSDQVMKLMKDIVGSNLNEYLKIIQVERPKQVKKPLQLLIDRKNEEIICEKLFAERRGLAGEELDKHFKGLIRAESEIIRLEIKLERNPDATFNDTEYEIVEEVELDIVKLASDKEAGRIKSFKHGKYGIEVEMYAIDSMLDKLARANGMYKDNLEVNLEGNVSINKWLEENASDTTIRELSVAYQSCMQD